MTDPVSGTWQIVASSLPFWRSRSAPAVSYLPLPDGRVLDAVTYVRGGRDKLVLGVDTRTDAGFEWRGLQHVTRLTTSRWQVIASDETAGDPADRWAVTAFDKTLFTPAGVDIYCRARDISPVARAAATAALAAAGLAHHPLADTSA